MSRQGTDTADTDSAVFRGKEGLLEAGRIFAIAAQFGLVILAIRTFGVQTQAFHEVALLTLAGFLIHAFLPMRYRLPFFTVLSIVSIYLVLGAVNGSWLLGLGIFLIGICHLPFSLMMRIGILTTVVGLLVVTRFDWTYTPSLQALLGPFASLTESSIPWSAAVWPILGSMFMFRLIIYLYDLHHEKDRPGIWHILSYFFMIPNICFPLFPVIDYKKFHRHYFNEEAWRIYQRGILWIYRGAVHLILYRFVYLYMTVDPLDVNGLGDMLQFSLASFLLYLQVSGQFHLIIGMLLLFGFNLPETHHYYYLASSFTDFWRRINIYWKDFMMKIFYYPLQYRLRKLGDTQALVISTLVVFFSTWLLHMYQWFWLRGTLLLEWHDALFWGILGVLVIVNSLYEVKYGRARSLGRRKRTVYDHAATFFGTAATFTSICLLWGMWSSDSLSQWLAMWKTTGSAWLWILVLVPVLFVAGWYCGRVARHRQGQVKASAVLPRPAGFLRLALPTALSIVVVYSLGQPAVYDQFPSQVANAFHGARFKLNKRDLDQQERGYYEDLIGVNRHNNALWDIYSQKPEDWDWQPGAVIRTDDYLELEFAPNITSTFKGAIVTTNRWGMRDRDYQKVPAPGTHRIALLGASHVFGSGVNNNENFDSLLEDRLNGENTGDAVTGYEILNFSRSGRTALHQVMILEQLVLPFRPDTVVYVAHPRDAGRVVNNLARQFRNDTEIPYPFLVSILEKAGVSREMDRFAIEKALVPYGDELLSWAYERMVEACRRQNVTPVWVLLPMTYDRPLPEETAAEAALARAAGFTVISLEDVYDRVDPADLAIAPWDNHPNQLGHRLIAEHLYRGMQAHHDLIPMPGDSGR